MSKVMELDFVGLIIDYSPTLALCLEYAELMAMERIKVPEFN